MTGLGARQKDAVTADPDRPLLVLAGAGSGKTRVLVARAAWLLERESGGLLAITFTNKAAEELRGRLDDEVGASRVVAGTFHAVIARILRSHAGCLDRSARYTIYDKEDTLRAIRRVMSEKDMATASPEDVASVIGRAKAGLVDLATFSRAAATSADEVVASAWEAYEEELCLSDALDFDDILTAAVRLFEENPEILAGYRRRFTHVLVDEFQDTNTAQLRLLQLLARGLTAVGDDDQAIYRFRGGSVENVFSFERNFPGARVTALDTNYRSTPEIVAAAGRVIAHNLGRREKKVRAERARGEEVLTRVFVHAEDEARWVAARLQARGDFGESAVLFRSWRVKRQIESALVEAGIPYEVLGGPGFFAHQAIKDALAYLRLVVNPNDREAFERAILAPRRGVGQATERVVEFSAEHGISLVEACGQAEMLRGVRAPARRALFEFGRGIAALSERDLPSQTLTGALLMPGGLASHLSERADRDPAAARALERLRELRRALVRYETDSPSASLSAWLERASLLSSEGDHDPVVGRVSLATVHAAKGLEWRMVFVCGAEDGVFPSSHARSHEDLEEERRLFYVAQTRAKDVLVVTAARVRDGRGRKPSGYLTELRAERRAA